jgi:hypothetical protein
LNGSKLVVTHLERHGAMIPPDELRREAESVLGDLARLLGLEPLGSVRVRNEERRPYSGSVELAPLSGSHWLKVVPGVALDISKRGIGIICDSPVALGPVEIRLADGAQRIIGTVVRCRVRSKDQRFEVGVELTDGATPKVPA